MIYEDYNYPPECIQEIERLKCNLRNLQWEKEKLESQLTEERQEKDHLEFRVCHELEPRIQAEQRSYDAWATTDPSAEGCEHWLALLDEMVAMVDDNPSWFDWETQTGNLDERILWLIKHREDAVVIHGADYIKLKENK